MSLSEENQWFAMRVTYRRGMRIKSLLDSKGIKTFIPMRYELQEKNSHKKRELVPVIRDLIFVYAAQSELQQVKYKIPYLQYMVDIRNGQKIIVPNDQMRNFIAVAGTYDEHLIFFSPDEVNLNLMVEYDSRAINCGFKYSFWKDYINAVIEFNRCRYFSGGLIFKVHLK